MSDRMNCLNEQYCFTLNCYEGKFLKPSYVYMLFYEACVQICRVQSSKMEKNIYNYIKEIGKNQKVSMSDRMKYRQSYSDDFSKNIRSMDESNPAFKNINKEVVSYSDIKKVEFQFTKQQQHIGADDAHNSVTTGYILLKTKNMKLKVTHNYSYHEETRNLLINTLGDMVKIYS